MSETGLNKYDFMKARPIALIVSVAFIVLSVFSWVGSGDGKYGVDFLGGSEVVVRFENPIEISAIRKKLSESDMGSAVVQMFEGGTQDISIRLKADKKADTGKKVRSILQGIEGNSFTLLKEDFVGPIIGEQIRNDGITALTLALICILVYISFRFEWRFAVGAILALVHDVIITTGVYVLSGREISAAVLAALLTIIGYSLNDTIIVYDRIRENLNESQKKKGKKAQQSLSFRELVNMSINQTLSRTLLTSLTTLFVVATLCVFGGGAVVDLAFTLVVGVVVGTYSSIFVACSAILLWEKQIDS